jgi:Asp-tRNA(Asn)/Glu-tRNA(Gln) amidotransferase A subunit family amidase
MITGNAWRDADILSYAAAFERGFEKKEPEIAEVAK